MAGCAHLQRLKSDPVFADVGGARLLKAIADVVDGTGGDPPAKLGRTLHRLSRRRILAHPDQRLACRRKLSQPSVTCARSKNFRAVRRCRAEGGWQLFLSGSHQLIHDWFRRNPLPANARSADLRRLLLAHPYLRDLHGEGDPAERAARFMGRPETWAGIPLRVIEQSGKAGDILLTHPLLLHVAAPNNGAQPRFLLSGGVTSDMWGWGS